MLMVDVLVQLHSLLNAAVVIVVFSLLAYIGLYNWRNAVARSLCVLLLSTVVVYGGDILLARASRADTLTFLLRAQWFGITLVPAAYFHLALALRGQAQPQRRRRVLILLAYALSMGCFLFALSTDLVIHGGIPNSLVSQLSAGPLFWVYALALLVSMLLLLRAIIDARRQALSPRLRRRLTYLALTFAAPGLGVFPYLAITESYTALPQGVIFLASMGVSVALMVMVTVMTYSVAFQGLRQPDRLIKYDFLRWGLYGPLVGITIILCIQVVPWLERLLGLPADTLITFVVMIMTVLMPLLVSRLRPVLDALIYRQDQAEIDYIRELPRTMFTQADLRQLLENTLIAVCGSLDVETGFVAGRNAEGYTVKAICGTRRDVKQFVGAYPLAAIMPQIEAVPLHSQPTQLGPDAFWLFGAFRLLPLYSPDGLLLGALGVEARALPADANGSVSAETRHLINTLAHQIELALTTVEMQQRLFATLRSLGPEMQSLRQLTSDLDQATAESLPELEHNLAQQDDFPQIVKEALTHYWGGPKLSDSPLLGLRTVKRAVQDTSSNPTRALQTVLRQAITNMRPDDQLDPTAQEWMLYNILELRFLQGRRTRDIANRLAMSESDYYRKQRIAVEEVARQLARMEEDGPESLPAAPESRQR